MMLRKKQECNPRVRDGRSYAAKEDASSSFLDQNIGVHLIREAVMSASVAVTFEAIMFCPRNTAVHAKARVSSVSVFNNNNKVDQGPEQAYKEVSPRIVASGAYIRHEKRIFANLVLDKFVKRVC